jgi:hypothetical protein
MLEFPPDAPSEHLRAVGEAWRSDPSREVPPTELFSDLAALLGVGDARDADSLGRHLLALTRQQRVKRADGVRLRILSDLRDELRSALEAISFNGFGFDREYALRRPGTAWRRLEERSGGAQDAWHESRRVASTSPTPNSRLQKGALARETAVRAASREPLFEKKRIAQAAAILRAWDEIGPSAGERAAHRLRALVLGPDAHVAAQLTAGANVARGVRFALLQRQSRVVAAQVVDVCVCGAIPPYGPLLGGKLAALAALSRDVAQVYFDRYDGRASEITSQMAARLFTRPADLLAASTTSFFGVGSSQYERLSLPSVVGDVRWRFVGASRGHGTLHFSQRTSRLLDELMSLETGRRLITSRFGEGPSERLRKIRDGLQRLGIDAKELLHHGMPRRVYVAELVPRATRPGSRSSTAPWRTVGMPMAEVAAYWRQRWLKGRLASTAVLDEVGAFRPEQALLSLRLRSQP